MRFGEAAQVRATKPQAGSAPHVHPCTAPHKWGALSRAFLALAPQAGSAPLVHPCTAPHKWGALSRAILALAPSRARLRKHERGERSQNPLWATAVEVHFETASYINLLF